MPTASGHTTAILGSKVKGTSVHGTGGEKLGHIEDIVLDKTSNNIMFAVIGFGGVFGIGEKYHPVPWSVLSYDKQEGCYRVPLSKDTVKAAPVYDLDTLTHDDGKARDQSYLYYKVDPYWQ